MNNDTGSIFLFRNQAMQKDLCKMNLVLVTLKVVKAEKKPFLVEQIKAMTGWDIGLSLM
jgi:hypothetical protein